jgi:D-alanyl-lipoteichoic acid acyltransferase DltB (MBOAT superfamily)
MIIQQSGDYKIRNRRILLTIGILANVLLLGYYKYTDFFISNYNFLFGKTIPYRNIVLPIGISFFTFQLIAYIIDCYKGKTKEYSVINYLLFITFFPQLIVGPIVHHSDTIPQFEDVKQKKINFNNLFLGIFIFCIGCAKKTILADPLTDFAQPFFADVLSGGFFEKWTASIAYTFSYYFDLSGYADMAIGLGLFFNIKIPQNFNSPYKARNFKDYWRRWHMTLSRFLSDYIFRLTYRKGTGSLNFYISIMFTFFVSGFWHGAGWNFVLWGIINGIFVCMGHIMTGKKWSLPFPLAWLLTMLGVIATRILFVSKGIKDAFAIYKGMLDIRTVTQNGFLGVFNELYEFIFTNFYTVSVLILAICIALFTKNTSEITEKFSFKYKYAVISGVLFVISLFQMASVGNFLYFQF